jgi:hypothetical protein
MVTSAPIVGFDLALAGSFLGVGVLMDLPVQVRFQEKLAHDSRAVRQQGELEDVRPEQV